MGFEPMIRVLQTLALASWPRRLADRILSDSYTSVKRIKRDVVRDVHTLDINHV